jgi:hypothetical protein
MVAKEDICRVSQYMEEGHLSSGQGRVHPAGSIADRRLASRTIHNCIREQDRVNQVGPFFGECLQGIVNHRLQASPGRTQRDADPLAVAIVNGECGILDCLTAGYHRQGAPPVEETRSLSA